jgi:hypothetical protein
MKPISNSFTLLGVCLSLSGLTLVAIAFIILQSTPITALGLSTIILGAVSLALGRSQPKISQEASELLLQSGIENISAIVEELGLKSKAIYLPSSMTSGKPQALIPIHSNPHPPKLGNIVLPKRLIVKHGSNPDDMGLLVTTPGSAVAGIVTTKSDATEEDLETALTLVLVSKISLADGAKAAMDEEKIRVEISNPRLEYRKMWVYESIGSPIASIVASVVAEVLNKPVTVDNEQYSKGKGVIELKLTGRNF